MALPRSRTLIVVTRGSCSPEASSTKLDHSNSLSILRIIAKVEQELLCITEARAFRLRLVS